MSEFTEKQCAAGECLVECSNCECTIHLDDDEDFALCEECCSEEPFLSMLSSDDWNENIHKYLSKNSHASKE